MRLKNVDIQASLARMARICGGGNRLPTIPSLRADRTRIALARAWEPCETERQRLIQDFGTDLPEVLGCGLCGAVALPARRQAVPGTPGWEGFVAGWNAMAVEEQEVEVQPITLADIEAGYSRDPATGQRGPFDYGTPEDLGALVALGFVLTGVPEESASARKADTPALVKEAAEA